MPVTGFFRIYDGTILLKMGISTQCKRKLAFYKRKYDGWCPRTATLRVEEFPTRQAAYEALLNALANGENPQRKTHDFSPSVPPPQPPPEPKPPPQPSPKPKPPQGLEALRQWANDSVRIHR